MPPSPHPFSILSGLRTRDSRQGMQTVIVDRKESTLTLQNRGIRIAHTGQSRPQHLPLAMVERLVIMAAVDLRSSLLTALAEAGVSVLILSPRDHRRMAMITPPYGRDHALRMAQYQAVSDPQVCMRIATVLVKMKLLAQWRTLRTLSQRQARMREALRRLPEMARALTDQPPATLEAIRGAEGGGAALYFAALQEALPPSLDFHGRKRRPPTDPFNALLSLGYTMLHFDAVRALLSAGFDPCLGFLHCTEYSRESLACDVIEPLRPVVDRFVIRLFREQVMRPDHFVMQQGACRMGKSGRQTFYLHWEQFAPQLRRALRRGIPVLRRQGIGYR